MSTTTTKKQAIDFLWEWAETQGEWAKLLIHKVVASQAALNQSERQEIFNYFLQGIGLMSGLPPVILTKPAFVKTSQQLELTALSNVSGVNKLAPGQTIQFGKNLTVIFGENGTGKTGYGRILKQMGYSYDPNNKILSNIYAAGPTDPSATISYTLDSTPQPDFAWNLTARNAHLQNIAVFNNNCVAVSLVDRTLMVTPMGFHLFNLVSTELQQLEQLLQTKKGTYTTALPWLVNLTQGTKQHAFMEGLNSKSDLSTLVSLSSFGASESEQLTAKEAELSGLNKPLLEKEISDLIIAERELNTQIAKVTEAHKEFTPDTWKNLSDLNQQIQTLEQQKQGGIKEIAEAKGVQLYETKEFQSFLRAADDYIKVLDKPDYPSENDSCVYCQQPLDEHARKLLSEYKRLLNDTTQEDLNKVKIEKEALVRKISNLAPSLAFHQPIFGTDSEGKPVLPQEVSEYNETIQRHRETYTIGTISTGSTFAVDYQKISDFLAAKQKQISETLIHKREALTNLSTKEVEIRTAIAELKDRKLLTEKIEEIKTAIENHKVIQVLNSKANAFNTNSISRKATAARGELIESKFNEKFVEELKAFRKGGIKIDLDFGTTRGNSKIAPHINSHLLSDILSEGEQKAIALAEFLAELQLDNVTAPVIFDDPVNSLDHNIIDDVSRRLVILSKNRQVIVFTHSILLFNSLLKDTGLPINKSLYTKFYNTSKEFELAGYIYPAEEVINTPNEYVRKINMLFNNTPKDRKESDIAAEGYAHLRSALELVVEHEVFQGTVKRYQKNIGMTPFLRVKGAKIDEHKEALNVVFERCCGFIDAHSDPEEVRVTPTLENLKADFATFNEIREQFNPNKK